MTTETTTTKHSAEMIHHWAKEMAHRDVASWNGDCDFYATYYDYVSDALELGSYDEELTMFNHVNKLPVYCEDYGTILGWETTKAFYG